MGDDGIAIHGSYFMLQHATHHRWVVLIPWSNVGLLRVGDKLKLYGGHGGFMGRTYVKAVRRLPDFRPKRGPIPNMAFTGTRRRYLVVTVSNSVADAAYGDLVDDTNADGSNFVVRDCVVGSNRGRGILIKADDGIIKGNLIHRTAMCGINVTPEFWWDESGASCRLLIVDNTIRRVATMDWWGPGWIKAGALNITSDPNPNLHSPFAHQDLVVAGNRFVDDNGTNLLIADSQNAVVADNLFFHPMQGAEYGGAASESLSLIWLRQCKNILLAGNRVIGAGPAMKKLVGIGSGVARIEGVKIGVKTSVGISIGTSGTQQDRVMRTRPAQ
jgi:hypothetical protein